LAHMRVASGLKFSENFRFFQLGIDEGLGTNERLGINEVRDRDFSLSRPYRSNLLIINLNLPLLKLWRRPALRQRGPNTLGCFYRESEESQAIWSNP